MRFQHYLATLALTAGLVLATGSSQARDLTVVSWGGQYTWGQVEFVHKPFSRKIHHNNRVNSKDYNGGIRQIREQVLSGNVTWDVVDVEKSDAIQACEEDLLEVIDPAILPAGADGTPATEDFIQGALLDCGVASVVSSIIYTYIKDVFRENPPTKMSDFFDLKNYPGKRGLRKGAKGNLEIALIADGVPAAKIYDVLGTPEGVARAFKKLDTIKNDIVYWEAPSKVLPLLKSKEVVMSTAYHSRIFHHQLTGRGGGLDIVWDGQIYDFDFWVIPKGTEKLELALMFLKFSTATEQLANLATEFSYGPARKSSLSLVGRYPSGKVNHTPSISMGSRLPTTKVNLSNAVQSNTEFWLDNGDNLHEQFNAWLYAE